MHCQILVMVNLTKDGWTQEVFAKCFEKFCKDVKERPLLLIYDRYMTHVTIPVITLAMKENVILIKLLPHCTDLLQVLDKICFSSLKKSWEQLLGECANMVSIIYFHSQNLLIYCALFGKKD